MSIITISRGSYCKGKEIAERVAARLGYECISREIVLEASQQFDIPEIKLVRAIHDAPSILDRLTIKKSHFVAYFRAALLRHLARDNVVYHGLAGHFFVDQIPHALKVRVLADWEDRVCLEMERNGLSRIEAERILADDDEQRRKWSRHLYGIDTADPSLYDMVLHVGHMTIDDAVEIIRHTVELETFQTTPESERTMKDILLAAEVQVATMDAVRDVEISAHRGTVFVRPTKSGMLSTNQFREFERLAMNVSGVEKVESLPARSDEGSEYSNPWFKL